MFLSDQYTFQVLSKLIPRLTLGSDEEICKVLCSEELNYLERLLSFTMTEPRIMKLDFSPTTKTEKTDHLPFTLLEDFSTWIYKTFTSDNLLNYISKGLFELEIVEFDKSYTYLMEGFTTFNDITNDCFFPSSEMVMDAVKLWEDDFLKNMNIEVKPTQKGILRFTQLNEKGTKAVHPLSLTLH